MNIYLTHFRTASTGHMELLEDIVYPQRVHWFPDTYARTKTGMFYVPHRLASKVLDQQLITHLRENPVGKTAFILAAGNTNFAGGTQRPYPDNRLNYVYKFLPFTLTHVYAARIAESCGAVDQITTDSSACASSLKVMMDVQNLICHYGFDRVIVLTVEDAITNAVLEFFGEARAVLTAKEETDGIMPSAFDARNHGFYVGQGAAFAVFHSERAAERQGLTAVAQLLAAWSASERSTNAIGQREDGEGYIKAIFGAIEIAGVSPERITIVKTHGTGTVSNNLSERAALAATLKSFVATSYKQKIGHTLGSSGLLETILLLEDVAKGEVPAIPNRTEKDSVFLSEPITSPDGLILSLAAGMGNIYSAAILRPMLKEMDVGQQGIATCV